MKVNAETFLNFHKYWSHATKKHLLYSLRSSLIYVKSVYAKIAQENIIIYYAKTF